MTRLLHMLFGRLPPRRNTDETVEVSKHRVREAVKGLEKDVLVLVAEALRPIEHEPRQ